MSVVTNRSAVRSSILITLLLLLTSTAVVGQTSDLAPGGWVERQGTATRWRYTATQLQAMVPPTRGAFTFPSPYNTRAVRITDASDCGGADCVFYVGYSYWRNTNAHEGSNTMWIFLGLSTSRGGQGPTLFQYNKTTEAITKVGPLFPVGSKYRNYDGGTWYFSGSRANKLYIADGTKAFRYDVVSQQFDTVFDIGAQYGTNRYIYQMHSSNDDRVHSATLRDTATGAMLGCIVYNETTRAFSYFARTGTFDECHIDKSGRYLVLFENIDGQYDLENIFIDLQTGTRTVVYDQNGAVGHHDMGYGYMVGGDNWNTLPSAALTFSLGPTVSKGPAVWYSINWNTSSVNHISHANAKPGVPMSQQYACGSNLDYSSVQNEILCFRLDGSYQQLVVAPVMSDANAVGGCCAGHYSKMPKGNLDITGKYFIWTANLGGNRLDAYLVKVPSHLLVAPGDTTPPYAPQNLRIN